jgi:predicted molibdopterin-dependent oxidoreductase YjgC
MFSRSSEATDKVVTIHFDGRAIPARQGDSVTAALIGAGEFACRTTAVSGVPRAPYCMMGVCFDCLVVVDGVGNQQGCLTPVRDGMRVERQRGRREVGQ